MVIRIGVFGGRPPPKRLNGECRIWADERTDVAAGLVGELLQQRKSRRGQVHVCRRLRIDVDERVDVEGSAAAGAGEVGLGGKDLDRRHHAGRWRHAGCGMRVAERAGSRPRRGRPQEGQRSGQESSRKVDNSQANISRRYGPQSRPVEIRIARLRGPGSSTPRRKSAFIGRCGADATRTVALPRQFDLKKLRFGAGNGKKLAPFLRQASS